MIVKEFGLPDALVMPVRRYLHPETGGRVTFVAMIHTAQPQFFAAVGALLEQLQQEGATVFMETQALASPEEIGKAKRRIRKRALALREAYDVQVRWAFGLGLVSQYDHLAIRPEWRVPDEGLLARVRGLSWKEALRLKAGSAAFVAMRRTMLISAQKEYFVTQYAAQVRRLTDPAPRKAVVSPTSEAMESLRESRVLAALDQQRAVEPDCHVVLVWGTDHLPRFDLALGERGFKAEGEDQWLTAIDVPSFMADAGSGCQTSESSDGERVGTRRAPAAAISAAGQKGKRGRKEEVR
jgi:hypothetical protein